MRDLNKEDKMLDKELLGQLNTQYTVIMKDKSLSCYALFIGDYQMVYDLLSKIEGNGIEIIKLKNETRI
jgi:hypothetical protein